MSNLVYERYTKRYTSCFKNYQYNPSTYCVENKRMFELDEEYTRIFGGNENLYYRRDFEQDSRIPVFVQRAIVVAALRMDEWHSGKKVLLIMLKNSRKINRVY